MYAVIQTGGKQYRVQEGDTIFVEKLDVAEGEMVTFNDVLLVGGEQTKIGTPFVKGASVTARVEKHGKGKKIIVFKYKPKRTIGKTRSSSTLHALSD